MEKIYTDNYNESKLNQIREWLKEGKCVEVNNDHETFYGFGMDKWLEEKLADIQCEIKVTGYDMYVGFASKFEITPKSNSTTK